VDDRGDGVEEGERALVGEVADGFGQRGRGERAGGDDDARPVGGGEAGDLGYACSTIPAGNDRSEPIPLKKSFWKVAGRGSQE